MPDLRHRVVISAPLTCKDDDTVVVSAVQDPMADFGENF